MTFLEDLFAFVGFDDGDRTRLRDLHPRIAPRFAAIASRFYEAVFANPGAAAVLSGPAQVERLRVSLVDWMSSGLLGPHDERFYEKRTRIGRRHVAVGLGSQYMFTAMTVLRLAYQDVLVELLPPGEALAAMRSVHKLLDCELAIMIQHYELDTEEKLVTRERRVQADRILAMQTMSAGLAHEVRNPLNAAQLQLELLERRLRRTGDDPKLTEPTELAQKEIERLTTLLNEFLVFARPPELHAQEHDIVAVIRQVVDLEQVSAEQRGVTLALETEPAQVHRRGRRRQAPPAGAQPGAQRQRGGAGRRPGRRPDRDRRRALPDPGHRQRSRHPRGGEAADLRAVLLDQGGRHGPRHVDRPQPGVAARGRDRPRDRPRRDRVRGHPAALAVTAVATSPGGRAHRGGGLLWSAS